MRVIDEKRLNEWKVSMENARHFNDLLMRLRMLGLPMVITLSVVGIASMQFISKIEMGQLILPFILAVTAVVGWIALIWHTVQKFTSHKTNEREDKENDKQQEPPLPMYWFEFIIWIIFIGIVTFFAGTSLYHLISSKEPLLNSPATYSLMPIALLAAVVLLASLYVMDRFYYYKLLLGAVSRLTELEESLGF
jgi:Na+/H+-dicarboxylate symporter